MNETPDTLSLAQVLAGLRRRAPVIALCTALVGLAAYGFSRAQTPSYTATASVVFETNPLSEQIAGLSSSSTNPVIQQAANVQLVQLGDMAAKTARLLGQGMTERGVQSAISVKGLGESNAIAVSASARSRHSAAEPRSAASKKP